MRVIRRVGLIVSCLSLTLTLGAGVASADQDVRVRMGDFFFEPADITVRAGEPVRFIASNGGAQIHEFRTDPEGIRVEIVPGNDAYVEPGQTRTSEPYLFTQPGTYDIRCPVAGHREAGMVGTLTVLPPGGAPARTGGPALAPVAAGLAILGLGALGGSMVLRRKRS